MIYDRRIDLRLIGFRATLRSYRLKPITNDQVDHIPTYDTAWIYIKRSFHASFVLNYLQNPTPDDVVALNLLLHDDDIDPY